MKRKTLLCIVVGLMLLLFVGCERNREEKETKQRLSGFDFTKYVYDEKTEQMNSVMTGTQEYDTEGRLTRLSCEAEKDYRADYRFEYDDLGRIAVLNAKEQSDKTSVTITQLCYTYYKDTDVIMRCEKEHTFRWIDDDLGENEISHVYTLENEIAFDGEIIGSKYIGDDETIVLAEYDPDARKVTNYYDITSRRASSYTAYIDSTNPTITKGEIVSESFYDENGKRLRTEYPGGDRWEYFYDDATGVLSEVYSYDSDGLVTSTFRFDEKGREIYYEREMPSWYELDELNYSKLVTETSWEENSDVPGGVVKDEKEFGKRADGTMELISECRSLKMPYDPRQRIEEQMFQNGETWWGYLDFWKSLLDGYWVYISDTNSLGADYENGRYFTYAEYENADYIFNDNKNVQYLDGVAASKMAAEFSGDVMKCTVKGKLPSPDSKEYKTTAVLEYDEYGNIKRKISYGEQGGIVAYEYEYEYRFYDETGE